MRNIEHPTDRDRLDCVVDAVIEDILNASPEETLAQVRETYGNENVLAAEAMSIFERTWNQGGFRNPALAVRPAIKQPSKKDTPGLK